MGRIGRTEGKFAFFSGVVCGSMMNSVKEIQEDDNFRIVFYLVTTFAVLMSLRAGGAGQSWSYYANLTGIKAVGFDEYGEYYFAVEGEESGVESVEDDVEMGVVVNEESRDG